MQAISSIDNIGRFAMYVGGNRSPEGNLRCQRESPTLSHEEWVWPGIEPTTSEVTGADMMLISNIDLTTEPLWQPRYFIVIEFPVTSTS
jgi:hypothetical protein